MAKAKTQKAEKGKGGGAPTAVTLWAGRGRALGALIGFTVVLWISHRAGMGMVDAALRGLIGAVGFSLVGWWCALLVITGLMRTAAAPRRAGPAPPAPAPRPEAPTAQIEAAGGE